MDLPTSSDVDQAATRIAGVVTRTPLQHSARLSSLLGLEVWLKREDLQPVRSYKLRGAYNLIEQLSDEARARGVTCASAGNHAQGVALACARAGVRARVHLPRTTPRQKRERIKVLGGRYVEIVIVGDSYDDAAAASAAYAEATGATPVPAFDDPRTIAGQGTVAREILEQLGGEPDAVIVPVGGGGLLAGMLTYLSERAPGVRVVGAEPAAATCVAAAIAAGEPVELRAGPGGLVVGAEPAAATCVAAAIAAGEPVELRAGLDGFVDGAAVRKSGEWTFEVVRQHTPDLVAVPEGLVAVEMLDLYQSDGIIAEPAGALASAALRLPGVAETAHLAPGATVVVIISGGNNDVSRYAEVVERALVFEGLKHYFLVEFPQEPGALRRFLDEVLGPDDDITLFEYVKRSNRETGPALVGIELQHAADLAGLLARMERSPIRFETVEPDSPLFRFVQ